MKTGSATHGTTRRGAIAGATAFAIARAAPAQPVSAAPASASEQADVVVVGAGLSGLTAARRLAERGRSVIVLEARDRVGGRTLTARVGDPASARAYDLGAQFVGPTQTAVRSLVAELGLRLVEGPADGKRIWELRDQAITFGQGDPPLPFATGLALLHLINRVDAVARRVGAAAPWEAADARTLDAMTAADWLAPRVHTTHTADLVACGIRAILGADPDEMSALFLASYVAQGDDLETLIGGRGGAQDSVIAGGTQLLSARLAERLGPAVRLGRRAVAVTQSADSVSVVTADGAIVRGSYVVIAAPPAVVNRIGFTPPLPLARRELQARAPMGTYAKVVATYPTPFWRAAGFTGEVASVRGPIVAAYDDSPVDASGDGSGALLGFIGGDAARRFYALDEAGRREAALDCFGRWFGEAALSPVAFGFHDWLADPETGGAPVTIMPPGLLSRCGAALREPCGRVHWAGTEAALKWTGYMDGAIRAGDAAADSVFRLF